MARECQQCKAAAPTEASFCPACGAKLGAEGTARPYSPRRFWAIVLLGGGLPVLLGLCVLSFLLVGPDIVGTDKNRTRQKRAMGELRSMGTAAQSYSVDNKKYPVPVPFEGDGWKFVPASKLESLLQPDYLKEIPEKDPWGHTYLYGYKADGSEYCVISCGRNQVREGVAIPDALVNTHCYESDIIFRNEAFVKVPEGKQRKCGKDID